MVSITFEVPGMPQGKGRPRHTRYRAKPFTPGKTVAYEAEIRDRFLLACVEATGKLSPDGGLYGKGTLVGVSIGAYYPLPVRTSKVRERLAYNGVIRPTRKPDIDNIVKAVLDGLNGFAWADDSQVVELAVSKFYSRRGSERVEVTVRSISGEEA